MLSHTFVLLFFLLSLPLTISVLLVLASSVPFVPMPWTWSLLLVVVLFLFSLSIEHHKWPLPPCSSFQPLLFVSLGSGEALLAPLKPPRFWTFSSLDLPLCGSFPSVLAKFLSVFFWSCFIYLFSLQRVDSVGAEELEDPAAFSEAQQLATEGKSWSLIILNLSLQKYFVLIITCIGYLYKMVWALVKYTLVLCLLVYLLFHMLTCYLW